jgi:hypothetical protein
MKTDEALRQQARINRKIANVQRAKELMAENPNLSREQALVQAVLESRANQNRNYSESGKNV